MDLQWLDDVLILLEEKNMTRAAARRHITQPAFSRRIKSFEDWVGIPLLERKANKVELSPSLFANEQEIRSLIVRVTELRNRVRHFKPERINVSIASQHALIFSSFPDIATITQRLFPSLNFRLRAGNRGDCISMFLRGDASMLLCYETPSANRMPFDESIKRSTWGSDRLVPVIGGSLRYWRQENGEVPDDIPTIIYPEQSYFSELLSMENSAFSVRSKTANPAYESAYSAGIKEMVVRGLGFAWLPMSMVYKEVENGQLVNLSESYGTIPLTISLYTKSDKKILEIVRAITVEKP